MIFLKHLKEDFLKHLKEDCHDSDRAGLRGRAVGGLFKGDHGRLAVG
jgi:hypothetical protein